MSTVLRMSGMLLAACLAVVPAHGDAAGVIPLWPEGVPGLRADASAEREVNHRVTNVHWPSLTVLAPEPAAANGTAVVYCPSGGYVKLTLGEDGPPEVRWLRSLGITVFLLKYRLDDYGHPAPLRDVLRALRIARSRAGEFGVRADRIGVFGASAGGHLAGCAAMLWDDPEGSTGAPLDQVNARPDFAMLVYPVVTMGGAFAHHGSPQALLGASPSPALVEHLSLQHRARADMPPVFIAATMGDKSVPVENSLQLYQALRAAGVPAELHAYATGSHGNSLDPQFGPTSLWPRRAEEWLRFNGWLARPEQKSEFHP